MLIIPGLNGYVEWARNDGNPCLSSDRGAKGAKQSVGLMPLAYELTYPREPGFRVSSSDDPWPATCMSGNVVKLRGTGYGVTKYSVCTPYPVSVQSTP
jgi:hypothetical protein